MRIPPTAAQDMVTTHGTVAGENILERARQYMMNTRFAIGGGRSFEKYIIRFAFPLPNGLMKNIIIFPKLKDGFLHFGYVKSGIDLSEHAASIK